MNFEDFRLKKVNKDITIAVCLLVTKTCKELYTLGVLIVSKMHRDVDEDDSESISSQKIIDYSVVTLLLDFPAAAGQ